MSEAQKQTPKHEKPPYTEHTQNRGHRTTTQAPPKARTPLRHHCSTTAPPPCDYCATTTRLPHDRDAQTQIEMKEGMRKERREERRRE